MTAADYDQLARWLYTGYCIIAATEGIYLPAWEDISENQRNRWHGVAAVSAAEDKFAHLEQMLRFNGVQP